MKTPMKTHCYKISDSNHQKIQALARKYGTAEGAFTWLLADREPPFVRADFARIGNHRLRVVESEALGWVKVKFLDEGFVMQAQVSDLVRYTPTDEELLMWRLTNKL
jgi:hypothetical protein